MTDCNICCETFNKSNRKDIGCSEKCGVGACRDCVQKYILSNAPHEPSCMGCKTVWPTKFLEETMTKKFMTKEISEITNQRLFEQQQMHFPAAQHAIVFSRVEKVYIAANKEYRVAMRELRAHLKSENVMILTPGVMMKNHFKRAEELRAKVEPFMVKADAAELEWRALRVGGPTVKKEGAQFVKGCCRADCRGFLNRAWNCGVCDLASCSKCHEAKDEDHECNPDNVATVELLAVDTKRCPKCACNITKIEGCDHMWCTNCNTGFSWRSGRELDNSRQTNPLYYEFMRRTQGSVPRTIGDGGCVEIGNDPPNWRQMDRLNQCGVFLTSVDERCAANRITMYVAMVRHIHFAELRRSIFAEDDGQSLRVRYLLGDTTKKSFIQTAKRQAVKRVVMDTVRNTLRTFVSLASERLNTIAARHIQGHRTQRTRSVLATLTEIDEIMKMTNKTFTDSGFTGHHFFQMGFECNYDAPADDSLNSGIKMTLYDLGKSLKTTGKRDRFTYDVPGRPGTCSWSDRERAFMGDLMLPPVPV
jgi:hypothetical protein